jgi:hypothetical protein
MMTVKDFNDEFSDPEKMERELAKFFGPDEDTMSVKDYSEMKAHPFERYIDEKEGDARFRATGKVYKFELYDKIMSDCLIFKAFINEPGGWKRCALVSCDMNFGDAKGTVSVSSHFSNIATLKYSGKSSGKPVSIPYTIAWNMMIRYIANTFGFIPALDGVNWDKGKGETHVNI